MCVSPLHPDLTSPTTKQRTAPIGKTVTKDRDENGALAVLSWPGRGG
jgi:hypothetical protein